MTSTANHGTFSPILKISDPPKESERLDRWTLEEAWKTPEGERPIGYQYNLLLNGELGSSDVKRISTLPATWTFYDDEVLDEVG
jgi:hypothetical protein